MRTALCGLVLPLTCVLLPGQPAFATSPRILYSDLESGPNSGGEDDAGAFITIYGNGFGPARGNSRVTVGGGPVASYPIWNDSRITFQLGHSTATGKIIVTTSEGSSNGLLFNIRRGKIYFVSASGNDRNKGSFTSPWKTLLKARDSMRAGDITYAMDGVAQSADDGTGWQTSMLLETRGSAGAPIAMVAYPGATVTIGNISGPGSGIRSKGNTAWWVFAGMNLRGANQAVLTAGDADWRIVGNDMTCPNGNGATACFETILMNGLQMYGNNVHDTGVSNASALYQGVYFSTNSNHIDFGWNTIANVHGCRGLQVHSSPLNGGGSGDPTGYNQFDISIHDNTIHDTQCDGIMLETIDPSKGQVSVYNNVIYNAGKGPNNPEGSGFWACINVETWTENGPAGSGTAEIFNNTLYNCGSFANPPYSNANAAVAWSGPNSNINIHLKSNILHVPRGLPYLIVQKPGDANCRGDENCPWVYGEDNLFFGSGSAPVLPSFTGSAIGDPLFVAPENGDFHIREASPARAVGAQFNTRLSSSPAAESTATSNEASSGYLN